MTRIVHKAKCTKDLGKTGRPLSVPPALDFMRVLWSIDHSLQRMSKRMTASLGITGPQRLVIRLVGRYPGITPGELAQVLLVHPSTLTGVLERLHRRGIITRRRDPGDRRRIFLGLTAKGRRYDANRKETIESVVRTVIGNASPGALRATRRVLERLGEALQEQCGR
jgi:DNA-binding MarR family transcriptional regulator